LVAIAGLGGLMLLGSGLCARHRLRALNRAGEYARAGVPMLPVVAGRATTKRQILIYCVLLVGAASLPCAIGAAGTVYAVASSVCGVAMIALGVRLDRIRYPDARAARRPFAFSILYLFVLFTALLADAAVTASRSSPVW
jgi:protoheme IX farnesyltransferase